MFLLFLFIFVFFFFFQAEDGIRDGTVTGVQTCALPIFWVRFPHMLLASYLTGASCVAGTGAWYLLRREYHAEARIMLRMGLFLAADRKSTRLNSSHSSISYAVFCLKKKKKISLVYNSQS